MTPTQKAVEAAVKAIYERTETYPNYALRQMSDILAADLAQAALTAALAVDGLALVPKEPTQAMIDAALQFDWGPGVNCDEHDASPWNVYRAMLAAANDGEERR